MGGNEIKFSKMSQELSFKNMNATEAKALVSKMENESDDVKKLLGFDELKRTAEEKATQEKADADAAAAEAKKAEEAKAAEAKKAEETKAAEQAKTERVAARAASDRGNTKVGYQDSTNRIGRAAWKNSVAGEFGEGKLDLADYSTATEVLDALLDKYGMKNLPGKETLLKDFIHNNKSVFNTDGKIHNSADASKLELPTKENLAKAKYADKPAQVKKKPPVAPKGKVDTTRSKAAQTKAKKAALAQEYKDTKFDKVDGKYPDALVKRLKADIKAGKVPGYQMVGDDIYSTTKDKGNLVAKKLDDVINAIKGYVTKFENGDYDS